MSEVTLREYFDVQLKSLREHCQREIQLLEERIDDQRRSDQVALEKQAREYERRLKELNNFSERMDKTSMLKVDRREWEDNHIGLVNTVNSLKEQTMVDRTRALALTEAKARGIALLYSGVGVLVSLVSVAVAYVLHR